MWIVKLGGSLHGDASALRAWLRLLAAAPAPEPARIVVPGGGPFADAVRALQPRLGFGDAAAHGMAILAMQQFALHLQALEPGLALAEDLAELRASRAAIWLPWRLAGREPAIAASWQVTSDSLACWLATRLDAAGLLLVKSAPAPEAGAAADRLAASGLVDPAFPAFAAGFAGEIRIATREDVPRPGTAATLPGVLRSARRVAADR
jgi:aspartokinase-like uncharacterized kinase